MSVLECIALLCFKSLNNILYYKIITNNNNSVAWVRDLTIPTERPLHIGEVSANFEARGVSRSQRGGSPTAVLSDF
jgi:hypothetical protein